MKILTEHLKRAIGEAMPVVRGKIPILASFRLQSRFGALTVHGSDCERHIMSTAETNDDMPSVCVSAANLSSLVQAANGEISLSLYNNCLLFKSGTITGSLPTLPDKDFPMPNLEGMCPQGVNCKDLAKLIRQVRWCSSTDTVTKFLLCSVFICGDGKMLKAIAADRVTFAVASIPSICPEFQAIVPDKSSALLATHLEKEDAELSISDKRVLVKHKYGEFSCSRIEGYYPTSGIDKMLGGESVKIGQINREWLLAALRSCVALCTDESETNVSVEAKAKSLNIKFHNAGGEDIEHELAGKFSPKEFKINAQSVIACLEQMESETVCPEVASGVVPDNMLRITDGNLTTVDALIKSK